MARLAFCLLLLTPLLGQTLAEEPARSSTPLQLAYKRQKSLYAKYRAEQQKLFKDSRLIELRRAWRDADNKLQKKFDQVSAKEQKAEKDARRKMDEAIELRIGADKGIATLRGQHQALEKKKRDLRFEIALTKSRLQHPDSPIQQELDQVPQVVALREAMRTSKANARHGAYKKYRQFRDNHLKRLESAQQLFAQIDGWKKEIAALDKGMFELAKAQQSARNKIRLEKDEIVKPLREKWLAAYQAQRKVYLSDAVKELRDIKDQAYRNYRKRRNDLTAANQTLSDLKVQVDAIEKEIRQLKSKSKNLP